MCFKNQILFYKYRKLKNLGVLSAVWLFDNTLRVKIYYMLFSFLIIHLVLKLKKMTLSQKYITSLILRNC